MGTMLQAAGLAAGARPELINLSDPDAITRIHAAYVQAGSEVVTTNTFGANALKLDGAATVEEVFAAATAAARASGARYIAGDIGPLGTLLRPLGTLDFEEAYELFAEQVRAAATSGVDIILIETVGVGQSETAVHSMVDFFLLVQIAGAGDELQGIKRGIMEMADSIIINKADGNNIQRAELAKAQLQTALHFFPPHESGVMPKVMTCSAYERTGIDAIWENILHYCSETQQNGYFDVRRAEQSKYWMYETIDEQLRNHFYQSQKENFKNSRKTQLIFIGS